MLAAGQIRSRSGVEFFCKWLERGRVLKHICCLYFSLMNAFKKLDLSRILTLKWLKIIGPSLKKQVKFKK
jgi:hypothetical protein